MSQDPVRLLPPPEASELPAADADGQRVLDRVAEGTNVVVLGAPGTGKTSLALRLLAEAVAGGRDAVLLAPTRARADWLRGRAAHLLREGHGDGVVRVRTPAALALTILTTSLTRRPDPLPPPVLLAGAEEDSVLASMISAISWPGLPAEATGSRAFRSELRNLLARAGELGITADELDDFRVTRVGVELQARGGVSGVQQFGFGADHFGGAVVRAIFLAEAAEGQVAHARHRRKNDDGLRVVVGAEVHGLRAWRMEIYIQLSARCVCILSRLWRRTAFMRRSSHKPPCSRGWR